MNFEVDNNAEVIVQKHDARKLKLGDESIDLIMNHPPYADIIKYSE